MARSGPKGKRGERELAHYLTDHGHPARRGQQYAGGSDSPDVVCPSLPAHWECKRVERLSLYESVDQAVADAGQGKVPVVAHKRNRKPWLAILKLSDLITLLERRS